MSVWQGPLCVLPPVIPCPLPAPNPLSACRTAQPGAHACTRCCRPPPPQAPSASRWQVDAAVLKLHSRRTTCLEFHPTLVRWAWVGRGHAPLLSVQAWVGCPLPNPGPGFLQMRLPNPLGNPQPPPLTHPACSPLACAERRTTWCCRETRRARLLCGTGKRCGQHPACLLGCARTVDVPLLPYILLASLGFAALCCAAPCSNAHPRSARCARCTSAPCSPPSTAG